VTLSLSGTGNVVTLGGGDSIKASGGGDIYDVTSSQLNAGETIAGSGSDTLAVTTAGTLTAAAFAHVSGVSVVDLAAGNSAVTLAANTNFSIAGGGNDTYVYGAGDGAATVINATNLGIAAHGEIEFSSGITDANLWFVRSGENLQIDILGSKSALTVADWFGTNKSAQVAEIVAGGLKLDGQTAALVTAMAGYQAANPGFNPQSAAAMPSALHNAIAAAWHS
jgi:hypothetical protein